MSFTDGYLRFSGSCFQFLSFGLALLASTARLAVFSASLSVSMFVKANPVFLLVIVRTPSPRSRMSLQVLISALSISTPIACLATINASTSLAPSFSADFKTFSQSSM